MSKHHGPPRRVKLEPVIPCPDCHGDGLIIGVFHQMPCGRCNGGGFLLEQTGDALPAEEQVIYLRTWLKRSRSKCQRQAELIQALEPYRQAKADADLAEAMYPERYKRNRRGGHGD